MAYARKDYAGAAAATTVSGSLAVDTTSITIASSTGWPSGSNGPFMVVIDEGTASEEKVLITSRSGTTLTVSDRGYDDTTAATHDDGASIAHCYSAEDADEANYWVAELSGAYDTAGDLAVADGNNSLTTLAKGSNSTVLGVSSGGTLGYATVATGQIAADAVNGDKIADDSIDSEHYVDGSIDTAHLAAAAVDENKLATSVAGDGLTGGGGSALAVNVDDATLAVVTDTVVVKDAGIDADALAASVAGGGLTGGAGSALAVGAGTGITVNANDVQVADGGVDTTQLADDAVTAAKLDSTMVPHAEVYRSGSTFARVNSTSYQDMTVSGTAQTKQITKRLTDTKLVVEGSLNGITPATGGGGNAVYSFGVNDGSTDHDVGSVFAHDNSFESQVCPGFAEITGLSAGTVTLTLRHKLSATGNGFGPTAGSVTLKITETF